MIAGNK